MDYFIQHFAEFASASVIALITFAFKKVYKDIMENNREIESMKQGLISLLRSDIINAYYQYAEKEYIPIYAMENVTEMYNAYHNLGGNGTVTKLFNELQELPTKKRSE